VDARPALGAYGFRLAGLQDAEHHLHEVPPDWRQLTLSFERPACGEATRAPGTIDITDDRAELWLAEAGRIIVTRDPLSVRFQTATPLTTDAVLHPFLGLPAAIAARWLGRLSLHGGAFVHEGRAWGLLGEREAGKSATLAALLGAGVTVLSDDILIVEGIDVFAGPRSIDLRTEAAALIDAEPLGVVGNRERWRLRPRAAPARLPFGGFIELAWGRETRIEPMQARDRLERIVHSTALRPGPEQATAVLNLAALPAVRLTRRPDLSGLARQVDRLIAALPACSKSPSSSAPNCR
jgi:hypothetical protein